MSHTRETSMPNRRLTTLSRYVFFGFVAVALYFLIAEHRAHVIPFLPFLLLAACPLMHIFMHRGHAPIAKESSESAAEPPRQPPTGGDHQH